MTTSEFFCLAVNPVVSEAALSRGLQRKMFLSIFGGRFGNLAEGQPEFETFWRWRTVSTFFFKARELRELHQASFSRGEGRL